MPCCLVVLACNGRPLRDFLQIPASNVMLLERLRNPHATAASPKFNPRRPAERQVVVIVVVEGGRRGVGCGGGGRGGGGCGWGCGGGGGGGGSPMVVPISLSYAPLVQECEEF